MLEQRRILCFAMLTPTRELVRLARFWGHLDARKNNELVRLQFVMIDEKVTNGHLVDLQKVSSSVSLFYVLWLQINGLFDFWNIRLCYVRL